MLVEQIKADMISARKQKSTSAKILITLKGEIDSKEKSFSPAREITGEEVVAIVKKFIKNIDETLKILAGSTKSAAIKEAETEKAVLEDYLPEQMSEDELFEFARKEKVGGGNMGSIMAALKAQKPGLYDGKVASRVVKTVLDET